MNRWKVQEQEVTVLHLGADRVDLEHSGFALFSSWAMCVCIAVSSTAKERNHNNLNVYQQPAITSSTTAPQLETSFYYMLKKELAT